MAEMISISRPDGNSLPIFYAEPKAGRSAPGIVLVQEWWGLNPQIKSVATRLCEQGYRVAVPDLYRGKMTRNADEANRWMGELDFSDACKQDLRACAQYLKQDASKVAVMGFCMGGALSLAAGVHVPELAAVVCFYGIPPAQLADPAKIRVPVQCHFANIDGWCTPEAVNALEDAFKSASAPFEIYRYEAEHAFFNDQRPEVYDPKASEQAWTRTQAFLKTHIA